MTDEARIEGFLNDLKASWRSCPSKWHEFHAFLLQHRAPDQPKPPVPLILAASAESAASKHNRLGMQLRWASSVGLLAEALDYLSAIPVDQWEVSTASDWNRDSYPSF